MLAKGGLISEIWHGEKWRREIDRHALSPMYDDGLRHYYIDEPAQLKDGSMVVPLRWFEDDTTEREVWFEGWRVTWDEAKVSAVPLETP